MKAATPQYIAKRRWYLDAQSRLVADGDPNAAYLLVAAGGSIDLALAERYRLPELDGPDPVPPSTPSTPTMREQLTALQTEVNSLQSTVAELSTSGRGPAPTVDEVAAAVLAKLPASDELSQEELAQMIAAAIPAPVTAEQVAALVLAQLPTDQELTPEQLAQMIAEAMPPVPTAAEVAALALAQLPTAQQLATAAAALVAPPSDERLVSLIAPLIPSIAAVAAQVPQPTDQRLLGLINPLIPSAASLASAAAALVLPPSDQRLLGLITPLIPAPVPGSPGKSVYQSWLDTGHSGTEAAFVASLAFDPAAFLAAAHLWAALQTFTGAATVATSVAGATGMALKFNGKELPVLAGAKGLLGLGLGTARPLYVLDA